MPSYGPIDMISDAMNGLGKSIPSMKLSPCQTGGKRRKSRRSRKKSRRSRKKSRRSRRKSRRSRRKSRRNRRKSRRNRTKKGGGVISKALLPAALTVAAMKMGNKKNRLHKAVVPAALTAAALKMGKKKTAAILGKAALPAALTVAATKMGKKKRRRRRRKTQKGGSLADMAAPISGISTPQQTVAFTPSYSAPNPSANSPWATGPLSIKPTNNC